MGSFNQPPSIKPDSPWLAPLAGYSDLPFRLLCREYGAAAACSEMVSVKGIFFSLGQKRKFCLDRETQTNLGGTWALLNSIPSDDPLIIQLFGTESEIFLPVMETVLELFADRNIWFDLNMGCAVPKVVKTGAGAAMLRDRENALKVAKAMLACAGERRVGFKLRLGWDRTESVYLELAKELEQLGAGWITLHPRYARQGYSGTADWDAIAALKQNLTVPIIASGDLLTAQAAIDCLNCTGADGVMFARGALYNPFIFTEFKSLFKGDVLPEWQPANLVELVRRHIELGKKYLGNRLTLGKMRGFVPRYVHNFRGVRALRQALAVCSDLDELEPILNRFLTACAEPEN